MPLLIGQPIDARELEQATSQWSPERFASMCDALVWAASGRRCPGFPSFTMRVNAADGGIDAEWEVEISEANGGLPTPIIGPGWNVFQYKKRDVIAQDRRRIISGLQSGLRKAIANVAMGRQRIPNRYIVFLNVDLKHDQTAALKKAIAEGYEQSPQSEVVVVDAGGLAALLNNHPHLRAAYFSPLSFKTWREADRFHRTQKLFRTDVALVGRAVELSRLRSFIDDPVLKVLVVTGPHDIGKTRLVLEATDHREHDIVFAPDPRSMGLNEYRGLVAAHGRVICVIEDPDTDRTESLINEILGIEGLKVVITLPASGNVAVPSYGQDERVQSIRLGPLSDEDSRKLLNSTGKHFDFGVESWILDQAGGNPGILLAAASVGEKLRVEAGDFIEAVGKEFEGRIKSELGRDALKCSELLSVLTHVGVSGKFEAELRVICDLFGEGWQPPKVLAALEVLQHAGLAKRGGSFAEITLPILARYLAGKLLRRRKDEVFALFGRLDESGRLRFLRQLSQVEGDAGARFWDALFDSGDTNAPFGNFASALGHPHMLALIAGTVPERTLRLLESGLTGTTREQRLAIKDEPRRELMWALEQLLFRERTSRRALRLVWLLAEAENEKWGNNATGVLSECFHPMHSQMPLPLIERLDALREFTSETASKEGKLVAIRAASKALGHGVYTLRHSTGIDPLDKRPLFGRLDVYDYARCLVDHLFRLVETEEDEVAVEALEKVPRLVFELGVQGQPEAALQRFRQLVEWAIADKPNVDVVSVSENVELLRDSFQRHIDRSEITDEQRRELEERLVEVEHLKAKLEKAGFAVRLKLWAGGWSLGDREKIVVDGRETVRSEFEIANLAKETVETRAFLTDELRSWLLSSAAPSSHRYFFYLGVKDSGGRLHSIMEDIGSRPYGEAPFSAYWGGRGRNNRPEAEERLRELADSGRVTGNAVVRAIAYLGPSRATIGVIKHEVLKAHVDARAVATVLYGEWIRKLSVEEFLELLRLIAGNDFENAAIAIDVLGRWLHEARPLEDDLAEFAWQCLEATPSVTSRETYDCDELAGKLAEADRERGFNLLEKLLSQPYDRKSWNPIDRYGARDSKFWHVLYETNRERALRIVFSVALTDPLRRFQVTWDLQDLLDHEKDASLLVLLAFENESFAELVSESITTGRGGFWPIAFKILEKYPRNEKIQSALTGGIEQQGEVHEGPYSQHLESCRKDVERVLSDPAVPAAARSWLREVLGRLEGEVAQHIIWEYDEDVNSLRRYIEDKESPERIWAIGRVLKYADLKDIRRLLTVEDISEALSQVDLPEKKRRALERALEVWESGS